MLTALTTSVDYADFLVETLPFTKEVVDRVIVITAPCDSETIRVATEAGADVFVTEAFFRNDAVFAKGSAINAALQHYKSELADSWLLHVDADVVLPERPPLEHIDKDWLYGAQRKAIVGKASLEYYRRTRQIRMAPRSRRITRPIGFYQLWHGSNWQDYPTLSDNASWDDMEFIKLFAKYALLGIVYHLQTPDLRRRGNWDGRRTAQFS
jgi:hypothetical protein